MLNEKENTELCQAVLKSIRYTPAFLSAQQQVIKFLTDQYYQGCKKYAAMSQQISRNNDAMIASIDKSYEQANSSYKPTNDGFSQYIKGVENYSDEMVALTNCQVRTTMHGKMETAKSF
jgi:hypothetical protein